MISRAMPLDPAHTLDGALPEVPSWPAVDGPSSVAQGSVGAASEGRDPLECLAAEFVERLRHGEPVSVDDYAQRHPHLADAIRELLPTVAAMEGLRLYREQQPVESPAVVEPRLKQLGDFRIIREIGRGGMGIVYEAEQESLRRRVAVKVLSPRLLSNVKHVDRFRVEAQTAARLHHTNIVQVFGFGEHNSLRYYVLQLIEGAGLDRLLDRGELTVSQQDASLFDATKLAAGQVDPIQIDTGRAVRDATVSHASELDLRAIDIPAELPERIRWAAQVGVQVAGALQYAHEQGVLHRDIKPGNLLVDGHGTVRVTDFGLATALAADQRAADTEIVGTFRYMAPEQFQSRCDTRTDVYSLGVTLYELVIGVPAFTERDRTKLITRIRQGELPRLRDREPRVPRDLDAIIARATAADPRKRYRSAGEFGADLQRFLEGACVRARPLSPVGRLHRWSRRNPALAVLSACLASLLASIAAVSMTAYHSLAASLDRETVHREKAATSSKMATDTLERIFGQFDEHDGLAKSTSRDTADMVQPLLSPETAGLLQHLLRYYDQLVAGAADDPGLARRAADARRRVGDIHQRLGDHAPAVAAYRDAIERHQAIESDEFCGHVEIARIHNELGRCYAMLGQVDDSRESYTTALMILERSHSTDSSNERIVFQLARSHYLLGRVLRPGQSPTLPPTSNAGPPHHGMHEHGQPRRPPEPDFVRIAKAAELLLSKYPDSRSAPPAYRQLLAACYREAARDGLGPGADRDRRLMDEALDLLRSLVKEFPEATDYRFDLMQSLSKVNALGMPGDLPRLSEALKSLEEAQEHAEQLMHGRPDVAEYSMAAVHVSFKLGTIQQKIAHAPGPRDRRALLAEAERSYRKAIRLQKSLIQRHPDSVGFHCWLARFLLSLSAVVREQGEPEKSESLLADAEKHINRTAKTAPAESVDALRAALVQERYNAQWAADAGPRDDLMAHDFPPPHHGGQPPFGPPPR